MRNNLENIVINLFVIALSISTSAIGIGGIITKPNLCFSIVGLVTLTALMILFITFPIMIKDYLKLD